MALSATELIGRMTAGDREAVAPFYDRFAPLVYPLVLRIVRDPSDAADVHQEVFWDAWQASETYDPSRETPEAWIVARAHRRAIDRVRSRGRQRARGGAALEEVGFAVNQRVPETVGADDAAGAVAAASAPVPSALDGLPEAQHEVIELAYYRGLTQTEIAALLTEPLDTVKARLRLGLERLRDVLGRRE